MKKIISSFFWTIALVMIFFQPALTPSAYAAAVVSSYQATPPFLATSTPPLVMLVMSRDQNLYKEAYTDTSDLDGDGILDIRFKPSINYYGYFDPYKVYTYSSGQFIPNSVTTDKTNGGVSGGWSGNFLNYLTMSRMDALRKVLYGGYRSTDSATTGASSVVLQRVFIPQDDHCWGKEYTSTTIDGYNIANYAPLTQPLTGTRHLFASVTLSDTGPPLLRVVQNNHHRIWEWVSKERPVADSSVEEVGCTNYDSYPANHSEMDTLFTTYGTTSHQLYSHNAATINGSGDPCTTCTQDYYITLFTGSLLVLTAGDYQFAVDGDDAVEVIIDGTVVAGWYDGHGKCTCTSHSGTIHLTAGQHTVVFHHQERTGDDSYYLYWKGPDSGSGQPWKIVPAGTLDTKHPNKNVAGLINLWQTVYDVCTPNPHPSTIADYTVKVVVCDPTIGLESNCKEYTADGTNKTYKPVGLLQKYGEGNKMYFGLMTGSYTKNTSGGVLRKKMGSITDEINTTTGQFITTTNGIIQTINKLRIVGFNYSDYAYDGSYDGGIPCNCGWITTRPVQEGECRNWGNPIAEIMYEALRYFAGKKSPTSDFTYSASGTNDDNYLGLPQVTTWNDPYDPTDNGYPACSKPIMLVISDITPSYDTDQLPGTSSSFGSSFSGDVSGLNVANEADTISSHETDVTGSHYIGQSGSNSNGACTPKSVSSLGNIRGLCPEEPTKMGGYYAASVAYFGHKTDLHSTASGDQKADTFAVALSSPLPRIQIPVVGGMITLVPFAKSVAGCYGPYDTFQPTNEIVDFFVDTFDPNGQYGTFRVNFADIEQGGDYDMDSIVTYHYQVVNGNQVIVTLSSDYAAGCIVEHLGYIISGTTADGTYLEVRDSDTLSGDDVDYPLDTPTPPGSPDSWKHMPTPLPLSSSRTFTVGASAGATLLKDPLWYAAKWGGFKDLNDNDLPDQQNEWDEDNNGTPDTYFYVTNPLKLEEQLEKAFTAIIQRAASGTAVAVLSTSEQGEGSVYQAYFEPSVTEGERQVNWVGHLQSFWIDRKGNLREDTVQDGALVYTEDDIIQYVTDSSTGEVKINKFHDSNGDGVPDDSDGNPANGVTPYAVVSPLTVKPIWEAGKVLAGTSAAARTIKTFVDLNKNGIVDTNEFIDFTTAHDATLRPYLNGDGTVTTAAKADDLINFIRGVQVTGYRDRQLTVGSSTQVWKLGDIVYSTPSVVGRPLSNFNVIYSDSTYDAYYRKYKDRDTVIYVGANDGMLHAFWAGKNIQGDNPATTTKTEGGWFDTSSGLGTTLGQELWAYIPYNLLPHLKWLADPYYPHVYYVDLKPKVADVKIFTDDTGPTGVHPNGWGTVLIGGMRLGGKEIKVTDTFGSVSETRTFRSAYFAIDITVPQTPKLLWEYTDTTGTTGKLGLTTSFPAVAKVNNKWFAIFGSGPTDITKGDCSDTNKTGNIFVLDLATGTNPQIFTTAETGAFFSDPVALDTQLDYNVDLTYIGETYQSGSGSPKPYQGKIYRLWAKNSSGAISDNPAVWPTPSALFTTKTGQPITTAPMFAFDNVNQLWAFFGTGKYMGVIDKTDSEQQAFYGIKEPCSTSSCTTSVGNDDDTLFNSTNVVISESESGAITATNGGGSISWSELISQINAKPGGWYLNLENGTDPSERVVSRGLVYNGIVLFPTFTPDSDVCSYGGSSDLFALDFTAGSADRRAALGKSGNDISRSMSVGPGLVSSLAINHGTVIAGGTNGVIYTITLPGLGEMKSGITSWRETK